MKSARWIVQAALLLALIRSSYQLEKFLTFGDDDIVLDFYRTATNGDLVPASRNKRVTVEYGDSCTQQEDFCIHNIGDEPVNTPLSSDRTCSLPASCKTQQCITADPSQYTDVSEPNSKENLILGTEAFLKNEPKATYLLDIRIPRRLENLKHEEKMLELNLTRVSGEPYHIWVVSKGGSASDSELLVLAVNDEEHFVQEFASLSLGMKAQIAILYNEDEKALAIILNGFVLYHVTNSLLGSIRVPRHHPRFFIEKWRVFNQTITTQELLAFDEDFSRQIVPQNECICPHTHPLLDIRPLGRPNSENRTSEIYGIWCHSLLKSASPVSRVPYDHHAPEFAVDGDLDTFWVSKEGERLSKLKLDLGTKYQVLWGKITMLTLPKYLVVTKQIEEDSPEEVLIVVAPNCFDKLPDVLPQGRPVYCKITESEDPYDINFVNIFHENSKIVNSTTAYLQWAEPAVFDEDNGADMKKLAKYLHNNTFLAQYISIYMYDFTYSAERHTINEFLVMSSCGCAASGRCSLNYDFQTTKATTTTTEAPDIGGLSPPISDLLTRDTCYDNTTKTCPSPVNKPDITGFICDCDSGSKGLLCDECTAGTFYNSQSKLCVLCECGEGSSTDECDESGKCTCDLPGAGENLEYADEKCHSFIQSITPSYGPVAGGTMVTLTGGWLDKHQTITLGDSVCKVQDASRTPFSAICKTMPVADLGTVGMYIYETSKLNFTYKPNPNITSIDRLSAFMSGGLGIPVNGANLDSIYEPKLTVTMVCKSSSKTIAIFNETCNVVSETRMICSSPNITQTLSTAICASQATRRKRDNSANQPYKYNIGFDLDGFNKYSDLSKVNSLAEFAEFSVLPDPEIYEFSEGDGIRRLDSDARSLVIEGKNLLAGVSTEDYKVTIGVGQCEIISLTSDTITCQTPESLPDATPDVYKQDPDDSDKRLPAVMVQVGNIKRRVGYVKSVENDGLAWKIAVGVMTPLLVIVAVAILLIICWKKQNKMLTKKQGIPEKDASRYVTGPHGKVMLLNQNNYLNSEHMDLLEEWLIPQDTLELGSTLGQGQFGKVFLGLLEMKSGSKKKVAVKTIKAEMLNTDVNAINNFIQEALIMKDFDHPNVLSLIGVVLNDQQMPMVVIPYMARGDLKQVLKDDSWEFTVGDLIHLGLQVSYGMEYLASKKYIHRDLAARNCMVSDQFYIKIADFGLSHNIYSEDYYRVQDRAKPLPVKWMAIESLTSGKYTVESDMWSYGVLLWEVITRGATPYPGVNNYDVKDHLKIGHRLPQPEYCPDEVYELMVTCWNIEPEKRPTFSEVSETLTTFVNQGTDYERLQTKEIDDDYYLMSSTGDDRPCYKVELTHEENSGGEVKLSSDLYDEPMPVESDWNVHTTSPNTESDSSNHVYCLAIDVNPNTNNSNNCESGPSIHNYPLSPLKPKRSQGGTTTNISEMSDYLHLHVLPDISYNHDKSTHGHDGYIVVLP